MLIYGTGGHAKVVFDCVISIQKEVDAFFDDRSDKSYFFEKPVMRYSNNHCPEQELVIAIGKNGDRKKVSGLVSHALATVIHISAQVSPYAIVGEGSMVIHNAIVQSHAQVGRHCIINSGADVDHDCCLGDYVHVGPNGTLCEGVIVEEGAFIGAGAILLPGVVIGKWAVVGAGSVVTKNISAGTVVAGNPARVIKKIRLGQE